MKKPDFDLASGAFAGVASGALSKAQVVLEKHRDLLQAPGVVGMWVGAAQSRPYIMVAVRQDEGDQLQRDIPDSLDGVSVYYIEGTPYS